MLKPIPITSSYSLTEVFGLVLVDASLLKNLMWFRCFEIFAVFFAGVCCHYIFHIEVPYGSFILSLGILLIGNGLLIARLKKAWPVMQLELFFNLMLDALVLCLFISGTGGAANPFVSLYLVLIAVSASILSTSLTVFITLFCASLYSYFFIFISGEQHMHNMHNGGIAHAMLTDSNSASNNLVNNSFQTHLIGMWINFLLSAVCLVVFIHLLRRTLSKREEEINQNKEQELRNEHILAIGSLAAGAAHELSTPLSTLNLLSDSILANTHTENDLYRLRDQLQICTETVNSLRISAANPSNFFLETLPLRQHLESTFDTWLLLWPTIDEQIHYQDDFQDLNLAFDRRLQQTLLSVLNNASEASLCEGSAKVFIELSCIEQVLRVEIYDEGKGVSHPLKTSPSQATQSTKRDGVGLGLMLSHSNMSQIGGSFTLNNQAHPASNSPSGTRATISTKLVLNR